MNKIMKKAALFFTVFLTAALSLSAKPSDRIKFAPNELSGVEEEFFTKIDGGKNDIETYYDGFLVASGIKDPQQFQAYKQKLDYIREKARIYMSEYQNENALFRGNALLRWLYSEEILKSYKLKSTLAQDLLDKGDYNCLTSSILYNLLALENGMEAYSVMTKNHSFCVVKTDGADIDVETTVAYGFNPGTKEIEEFQNKQRIVYVPKSNYRDRKNVGVNSLIAALYANSISLLGAPIGDIAAYKKGFYLDPNSDFFENNILTTINNSAINLINKGDYQNALILLNQADSFFPNHGTTAQNRIYYYNKMGTAYLQKSDFPSAINVFQEGSEATKNSNVLSSNLKVAYYNYALSEYNAKRYSNAKTICEKGLERFPNDRDLNRILSMIK